MDRCRAFTLIELLMVVAIIGVLVALLLPAIQSAREHANLVQCSNNLLQLSIAMGNYASTHTVLPPGVVNDKGPISIQPEGYHHGWTVQILPFIGQSNVYRRFDLNESVYTLSNETARSVVISTFLCPSTRFFHDGGTTYAGCHHDVEAPIATDNTGVLYMNSHVRFDDIRDGLSHTILLGESIWNESNVLSWASGTRATLRNTGSPLNTRSPMSTLYAGMRRTSEKDSLMTFAKMIEDGQIPLDWVGGFSSVHPGGANFAFCDGSVRFLRNTVRERVYRLLGNRADGELLSDNTY